MSWRVRITYTLRPNQGAALSKELENMGDYILYAANAYFHEAARMLLLCMVVGPDVENFVLKSTSASQV